MQKPFKMLPIFDYSIVYMNCEWWSGKAVDHISYVQDQMLSQHFPARKILKYFSADVRFNDSWDVSMCNLV